MEADPDLYCKLYVRGASGAEPLAELIASIGTAKVERRSIRSSLLVIDVFDQSRHVSADVGDDFVQWPHYLEIEAAGEEVESSAFVAEIARLMKGLGARGLRTVASCSFEAQLATAMCA